MVGERREDQIYRARHHEEPTEENRPRKQYEISHDQIRGQGLTRPRSGSAAARVGGRTGPEPSRCASLPPSRLGAPRREESGGGAAGDGKSRAGEESARSGREGLATYKRGPGNAYSLSSVSFTVSFFKKILFSNNILYISWTTYEIFTLKICFNIIFYKHVIPSNILYIYLFYVIYYLDYKK